MCTPPRDPAPVAAGPVTGPAPATQPPVPLPAAESGVHPG